MEQKNIEVQRKKGLNLMMKILITAIIPLIILVAFEGWQSGRLALLCLIN